MDPVTLFFLIDSLYISLVYAYGVSKMLPLRHRILFWVVFVGTPTVLNAFGPEFVHVAVGFVLILFAQYVLPFLLFEGSAPVKALAVLAAALCDGLAEVAVLGLLAFVVGQPVPEDVNLMVRFVGAHWLEYVLCCLVGSLLLLVLIRLVGVAVRRFAGMRGRRSSWLFVGFGSLHIGLMALLAIVMAMVDASTVLCLAAATVCALGLAANVTALSSMERAVLKAESDERAVLLDRMLEDYLDRSSSLVAEVEAAARARHDASNHAQLVLSLAERGEVDQARGHLASFAQTVRDFSERRSG